MTAILIILLVLCLAYLFAVQGRSNHPELPKLRGWKYAHRGLHDSKIPENSMAAFRAALDNGYGIELDVHLLADGNLAVMHDTSLKRTTGQDGSIEDLTTEQLTQYHLGGTMGTIPQFREVLDLFAGKAPLIVEIKVTSGNFAAVTEAACKMLESYDGPYCIESFDPRSVYWLKKHRPDIIRGQLTEDYFKTGGRLSLLLKWALKNQVLNFLTRPDFVAYRYSDRKTISNTLVRKVWGVQGVSWTLRTQEEFDTAVSEGWLPIFENIRP